MPSVLRVLAIAAAFVLVAAADGASARVVGLEEVAQGIAGPPVLVAVGDIACDPGSPFIDSPRRCQQGKVGRRVRTMVSRGADWFVPLGDNQYESGRYADYVEVYDKAFGSVDSITRPVAGNHEYLADGARGYFRYFKAKAGNRRQPWRSFRPAPGWAALLLDSNCEFVGGCGRRSSQGRWIKATLTSITAPCVIAVWHHPVRSSGEYAGSADSKSRARKLWRRVDAGGADIVLNGHDHIYERFAKRGGVQQFIVGTGGKDHYDITTKAPGSQKRIGHRYGVLRLTLRANASYRYSFVTAGGRVLDRGQKTCTNDPR